MEYIANEHVKIGTRWFPVYDVQQPGQSTQLPLRRGPCGRSKEASGRNIVKDNDIHEIWVPESDQLLIAFSGFGAGVNRHTAAPFNYMGITRKYQVNKVFLRDLRLTWYHWGLNGLTKNLDETAEYLSRAIGSHGIAKVAILGGSAGGYAALIAGWLLEAEVVHAIAPQTYIDAGNRLKYRELTEQEEVPPEYDYMDQQIPLLYEYPDACALYFDVKPVLEQAPNGKTVYHVHYCIEPEHDKVQAERLAGVPGVELHRYQKGRGHLLPSYMTRDGTLDRIIQEAFGIAPAT